MILGIDASRAMRPEKTGVEWYAWNIIQAMALQTPRGWRARLYSEGLVTELPSGWESRPLPWPPRLLWSQLRLGFEMLTRPPDVFFVPAHVLPFVHPTRSVVTIHDVAFRTLPEAYTPLGRRYLDVTTRFAVSHATRIIVPSKAVARDLHQYYGAPESRVRVVPHGPGITKVMLRQAQHDTTNIEGLASLHTYNVTPSSSKGDLSEPYFVAIGRIETKKNTPRIVEAYARAREKSETGRGMKLVLVGGRGVGAEETDRAIARSGLSPHIIRTGYLSDGSATSASLEEVALPTGHILADAHALIFPSLAEGFGLPILDAMTLGVPVLTSKGMSTEEVAGDAALLVDPKNTDEIAAGMVRLAEDDALRTSLIEKGKIRASQFSWEKAARETWKVIVEAAS